MRGSEGDRKQIAFWDDECQLHFQMQKKNFEFLLVLVWCNTGVEENPNFLRAESTEVWRSGASKAQICVSLGRKQDTNSKRLLRFWMNGNAQPERQGSLISVEIASFVCTFLMRVFISANLYTYKPDIPRNKRTNVRNTLSGVYTSLIISRGKKWLDVHWKSKDRGKRLN